MDTEIEALLIREALCGLFKGCEIVCRNPEYDLVRNELLEAQRKVMARLLATDS